MHFGKCGALVAGFVLGVPAIAALVVAVFAVVEGPRGPLSVLPMRIVVPAAVLVVAAAVWLVVRRRSASSSHG